MGFEGNVKGRRKKPYPNSILDRKAFVEALEEAGISVKRIHLDEFYKSLHKLRYPPLLEFVENYYANTGGKSVSSMHLKTRLEDETKENKPGNAKPENSPLAKHKANQNRRVKKQKNKMTLPRALLDFIATTPDFVNTTSRVKERFTSADESTTKLIVELYDGFVVESVLMRYRQKGAGRASLCVSSQCGCAMGCTFCATGTMGLSGNLTTGEILEQLVHADRLLAEESQAHPIGESLNDYERDSATKNGFKNGKRRDKKLESVRNVVFMGMGEPLDNYNNVTEACRTMIDRSRWNLAHGRVTVSTVGLISQIRRLTKDLPEVSLALSLHAPNQKDREDIVPTASRYPIEGLIDALDNHMMAYLNQKRRGEIVQKPASGAFGLTLEEQQQPSTYTAEERRKESSRRRAMIEYVMLEGESSSLKCAHQLGKLCENRHLVVNLIPYNATDVKDKLRCPSDKHMLEFRNIVQSYGTFVTIRRTMGADIASACGQLVQKKNKEQQEREAKKVENEFETNNLAGDGKAVDIEDFVVGKVNGDAIQSNEEIITKPDLSFPNTQRQESTSKHEKNFALQSSWIRCLSDNDLDRYSRMLNVVITVSATCFLASSALYLKKKRP